MPNRKPIFLAALLLTACQAPSGALPPLAGAPSFGLGRADEAGTITTPQFVETPGAPPTKPGPSLPSPATSGGSSGGGGAPSVVTGPAVRGEVYGLAGTSEVPLAGAVVATTDGRRATTDAAGKFALAGAAPADGVYVASHEGYAVSAVSGYPGDGGVRLHLKERGPLLPPSSTEAPAPITATGKVVDDAGTPISGVLVLIGGADGLTVNPAVSDARGAFTLSISAPGGSIGNGTLLAVDTRGRWVGMARHLSLSGPSATLPPLSLTAATHPVHVSVDGTATGLSPKTSLELAAPDGTSLALFETRQEWWTAALPEARYDLRIEATDGADGVRSTIYRPGVAIDFASALTTLSETLLAAPESTRSLNPLPGQPLSWEPVEGARGYEVAITSLDRNTFVWEGFAAGTSLVFATDTALAPGGYSLTLTAWDAPNLTPRSVASLGTRALRLLPAPGGYRKATRQLVLNL